jgi:hypothetical protein
MPTYESVNVKTLGGLAYSIGGKGDFNLWFLNGCEIKWMINVLKVLFLRRNLLSISRITNEGVITWLNSPILF